MLESNAMDPPKCKLCTGKHWPREPHKWGYDESSMDADPRPLAAAMKLVERVAKNPAAPVPKDGHAKFDKVAYQREYMRQRRRRAKATS